MPQLLLNCQGLLGLRTPTEPVNPLPNSHFGTNDPVQECQIPGIRTFIRHARARKNRLDEKIASLEVALNELYSERDALDEAICNHVVALSPIRRMPTEIISLIFTHCVENGAIFVDNAAWTLSAVCSRWREIALSPVYWTEISTWVDLPIPKLETILARSAILPLDIYFCSESDGLMSELETATLQLLVQHCERWEYVRISGPTQVYSIVESVGPRFSMLRTLDYDIYYSGVTPAPYQLDIFRSAPQLEEVLVNRGYWFTPVILDLPWNQLTTYRASSEWSGLSALASAVNLVECTLDMGEDEEPAVRPATVMHFPRLLRLGVSHGRVLPYLHTPVLEELYCKDGNSTNRVSDVTFPRTLQTLVFEADTDHDFDLMGILEALPSLESLTISSALPADSVCKFLASAGKKVSRLESVSLALSSHTDSAEFQILDTLEALDWSEARLRSFRFLLPRLQTPSTGPRLRGLQARGASVKFGQNRWQFYTIAVPSRFRFER
ncbi:hypothetical protein FB45DRAFT_1060310 [Roridomyces roridus]|uniref:F-box domain-containing protein n=1 Tax=Roridomyces roridus TaxID=1738132 RepID=A0AAD7BMT1_9AGAR|nr:hypothetical protein FB45DRAFT_1060310 [Roridomyces roridus]